MSELTRKLLLLLLNTFLCLNININSYGNDFGKYLNYAQNYYWLTTSENIGSRVYLKTLKYIKLAKLENEKLKNSNVIQYKINKERISVLEKELNSFYDNNKYTMKGFFPLLKFISTSFYFLPKKSRKYTLQKSADDIAVEEASESLISKISKKSQYNVFFNSPILLWNVIAFDKFNSNGFFNVHLIQENDYILQFNKTLINEFYANNINENIIKKFLNYADKSSIYIVRLEKTHLEKGDSYFTAYGDAYNKNGLAKDKSVMTFGYAIDMRWSWPYMIAIHIILLAIVFIVAYFYIKVYGTKKEDAFIIAVIAFLAGRILPWIVIPTFEKIMPNSSLNILYTIWWIALIGIAVMIFPIYGMNLVYSKLSQYIRLPSLSGKGGLVGLSAGAGIIGYLFVGYIFNFGNSTLESAFIITFSLLSISLLISSYVVGLVLDPFYKINESNLIYFAVSNTALFMAFLHGNFAWLNIASIIVTIISIVILFVNQSKLKKQTKTQEVKINLNESSATMDEIIKNPPFYEFKFYKNKK